MKSYEFLVIFSGLFEELIRGEDKPRTFHFERPIVRIFNHKDQAEEWADTKEHCFFDATKKWVKQAHRVYNLAEISSADYFQSSIAPGVKAELANSLTGLVFNFMHENYAKQYRPILLHQIGNKPYQSCADRYRAYANFMRRPVEQKLENELKHFREFFSGDVGTQVESSLIQYFEAYSGAKQLVQDVAVGNKVGD